MDILLEISENLQRGQAKKCAELTLKALEEGIGAEKILNEALSAGMSIVGEKFKNEEIFIPNVLVAARAMKAASEILKPKLAESGVKAKGVVVIGTVRGDMHDIGKNLVKMMIEGRGVSVFDLGIDVPAERFIAAAKEYDADFICCSALLTTTMDEMRKITELAKSSGVRAKIMIGGAPVTKEFCFSIGADIYAEDAARAADTVIELLRAASCKNNG